MQNRLHLCDRHERPPSNTVKRGRASSRSGATELLLRLLQIDCRTLHEIVHGLVAAEAVGFSIRARHVDFAVRGYVLAVRESPRTLIVEFRRERGSRQREQGAREDWCDSFHDGLLSKHVRSGQQLASSAHRWQLTPVSEIRSDLVSLPQRFEGRRHAMRLNNSRALDPAPAARLTLAEVA